MDRIVVFIYGAQSYLTTAFPDGSTPAEHVQRRVEELLQIDGVEGPVVGVARALDDEEHAVLERVPGILEWELARAPNSEAAPVFRKLDGILDRDVENLVILRLDAPFVDSSQAHELVDLHRRSWCDYTFADGYPIGYSVEVIRRDLLSILGDLAEAGSLTWKAGVLFETLSRDINAFDIETDAASEDYARIRASLTVDTRQNYLLCRRLSERSVPPGEMPSILLQHAEFRRTRPVYFQIQVTTAMVQRPIYTPWAEAEDRSEHIDLERWNTILDRISTETPEAIIAIGYRGDPACHPALEKIIGSVETYPGLRLYIETAGIGWSEPALHAVTSPSVAAVIIELDTDVPETYETLRGSGQQEAVTCAERLAATIPGRVFVQATRMRQNEWELQEFYQNWSSKNGVTVIIQKHNSYAGRIADRRVADLTPLERIPCRHLERDMVVLIDGTVPRCFQDLDVEVSRGSLLNESLVTVWERGEAEFKEHTRGEYSDMCRACDEYYTFNA